MVKIAKGEGCSVGFTTNGALLNKQLIHELIRVEIDHIGVSIAGAKEETHNQIRRGSNFTKLMKKINLISETKIKLGFEKPRVLLLYLMTRRNINELPQSIDLASNVGAEVVVATNIDYIGDSRQEEMRAFSCTKPDNIFSDLLKLTEKRSVETGVKFHSFPLSLKDSPVCGEDPIRSIYVSEKGDVSPCVYLNLPIGKIPRLFCGSKDSINPLIFGNINETDLLQIRNNQEYLSFRRKYVKRVTTWNSPHREDLPKVCKTCYKAYGI
jgi:MoaA/NifB/PqqE/SkfB family radical SAM enzyme